MKKLLQDRKTLYLVLCIAVVSVFTLSIAYAAMSAVLEIHGNSEVVASSWDIHLDNVKVTNGSVSGNTPTITSSTTASFSTTLNNPGDFYEFTIDVVNEGTIDAMIDSVSKTPTLTPTQAKYLNYIVEYQSGESINTEQLVAKKSFVKLKVRLEFRKDVSTADLPTTSETLNLAFTVNYVQSDGAGSEIKNNGVKVDVVSGDGTNVGDEVCISEECFYVISSTEDTVTMLAKYNLLVGYSVDENWNATPLANPTGIQDESAKAFYSEGSFPLIGTIDYGATNNYNGSTVEGYVNSYNSYLITQGVTPIEARLITKDELINLGCTYESETWRNTCSSAPKWVISTAYWSMTPVGNIEVIRIMTGKISIHNSNLWAHVGVRPVITISKDYL